MKPNVLFVNMPTVPMGDLEACFTARNEYYQPLALPLGILYLSSYLKKYGSPGEVGALDYVLGLKRILEYRSVDEFIGGLAVDTVGFRPDILAFSLIFSSSHHFFGVCVKALKKLWPEAVVVAGGTHASNAYGGILDIPEVDYVVRGEGEKVFAGFVGRYAEGVELEAPGVYSRRNAGDAGSFRALDTAVMDLDEIPFPDWGLIAMDEYVSEKGRKKSIGKAKEMKTASFITTRGCPFNCTYCSSHTVHGKKMRFRSVANIVEEVRLLNERYGASLFIPEDDLFTAKKERFLAMLGEINALGIEDLELQFPNALRINDLDEDVMDALLRTGLKVAVVAIESGSEYVQKKIIKKNVDLGKAVRVVKYLRERGAMVRCYFILGFPGETRVQMSETVEFARNLGADWCNFIIATPLVGSVMYDQFVSMGAIREDFYLHTDTVYQVREFDTPEISAAELTDFAYRSNLDVNFLNNYNKVAGKYERAIAIYRDILESYPFHVVGLYCVMECLRMMGDAGGAEDARARLRSLIKEDARARDMYERYADLMPDFNMTESD